MTFRNIALATAAVSLAAAPAIGQVSFERASAPTEKESELGGGGAILGALAVAAIVAGIVVAASDDDDDSVSG